MSRYNGRPDLGHLRRSAARPSSSPAPRISRSCVASTKPAPSSSIDSMASRRLTASRGQRLARRGDQIGVGAVMRAADAAAQLVQLRQPHVVGAVDHDGVGGRHVDAALDDGGAHQHVEAAVVEVDHQLLEVALAHLAVADAHGRLGHQRLHLGGDLLDGAHLVVHEVDLAAAAQLAQRRLAQRRRVPLDEEGLDRQARRRRRW